MSRSMCGVTKLNRIRNSRDNESGRPQKVQESATSVMRSEEERVGRIMMAVVLMGVPRRRKKGIARGLPKVEHQASIGILMDKGLCGEDVTGPKH